MRTAPSAPAIPATLPDRPGAPPPYSEPTPPEPGLPAVAPPELAPLGPSPLSPTPPPKPPRVVPLAPPLPAPPVAASDELLFEPAMPSEPFPEYPPAPPPPGPRVFDPAPPAPPVPPPTSGNDIAVVPVSCPVACSRTVAPRIMAEGVGALEVCDPLATVFPGPPAPTTIVSVSPGDTAMARAHRRLPPGPALPATVPVPIPLPHPPLMTSGLMKYRPAGTSHEYVPGVVHSTCPSGLG